MEKWRKTVFYRLSVVLAVCQPAASQRGLFIAVDRKRTAASRVAWDRVGLQLPETTLPEAQMTTASA